MKRSTNDATEADLEARIGQSLRHAFPWLPADSIKHQTTFSFQFGGKKIEIDGRPKMSVSARADVLVLFRDKPLAILELKRPSVDLTDEDKEQGLSYARVLFPSPPLVVISNGEDCVFLQTHSGEEWKPIEEGEEAINSLFKSAAKVASGELKEAIGTLMGSSSAVWKQGVMRASESAIAALTGSWDERAVPFVDAFLIPRKATEALRELIRRNERMLIVHGPPMSGKSSVLREFTLNPGNSDYVALFVENDGDTSIVRGVADLLGRELDWPISETEAREWLKRRSRGPGPILVVVVEGVGLNFANIRDEVTDLCSDNYGCGLVVVVELDGVIADTVIRDSTGRRLSKVGRKAKLVSVGSLDGEEFEVAEEILLRNRIRIQRGGNLSPEYRLPWVLRSVCGSLVAPQGSEPAGTVRIIPSTLSLHVLGITREVFKGDHRIRMLHRGVAAAVLKDAADKGRDRSITLESVSAFVVRKETLEGTLSAGEISEMEHAGLLKMVMRGACDAVYLPRLPELVASEAAYQVSEHLANRYEDPSESIAKWLAEISEALPFGDIIGAQALLDMASEGRSLSGTLIMALLEDKPRQESVQIGARMLMHLPGRGLAELRLEEDAAYLKGPSGSEHPISYENLPELGDTVANTGSWFVLAHLAGISLGAKTPEGTLLLESAILLEVGSCPFVLRHPCEDPELCGFHTHELPSGVTIQCHADGIAEQITNAIYGFLGREWRDAEDWIEMVLSEDSEALLSRVSLALRELSKCAEAELADFARRMLEEKIQPAFLDCCGKAL